MQYLNHGLVPPPPTQLKHAQLIDLPLHLQIQVLFQFPFFFHFLLHFYFSFHPQSNLCLYCSTKFTILHFLSIPFPSHFLLLPSFQLLLLKCGWNKIKQNWNITLDMRMWLEGTSYNVVICWLLTNWWLINTFQINASWNSL